MNLLTKPKIIKKAVLVNNGLLELLESESEFLLTFNDKVLLNREKNYDVNPLDIFLNINRIYEQNMTIKKHFPLFIVDENIFFYLPFGHIRKEDNGVMSVSYFKDEKLEEKRYEIIRKYTCCIEVKGV